MLYSRGCKCFDSKFRFRRLGFTSPLFSPNFSVLSLFFFFFFRQGFTGGPATCMQLHQRSREKKQALLLALCLMGLGVSLFLRWLEGRGVRGSGQRGSPVFCPLW